MFLYFIHDFLFVVIFTIMYNIVDISIFHHCSSYVLCVDASTLFACSLFLPNVQIYNISFLSHKISNLFDFLVLHFLEESMVYIMPMQLNSVFQIIMYVLNLHISVTLGPRNACGSIYYHHHLCVYYHYDV